MNGLLASLIIFIIFEIPTCFGMGLIFKKMKLGFKKGIIPFYNKIILINYYKLQKYNLIIMFIPLISLYTNYLIYQKMCKQFNKEFMYVLQLTFFPFVYNIFLGLELKENKDNDKIDNYFEDQKNLYEKSNREETTKEKTINKEEYVWQPKTTPKSNTVYKASRNNLNAKVNINITKNDDIIDNKQSSSKNKKENIKICPKCGAKMANDASVCFLCGSNLK